MDRCKASLRGFLAHFGTFAEAYANRDRDFPRDISLAITVTSESVRTGDTGWATSGELAEVEALLEDLLGTEEVATDLVNAVKKYAADKESIMPEDYLIEDLLEAESVIYGLLDDIKYEGEDPSDEIEGQDPEWTKARDRSVLLRSLPEKTKAELESRPTRPRCESESRL